MSKTDIMAREKIDRDRKTGDNMNGEERANDKLMARGITFKELKNLKGNTITEKLRNLGVKNFPKNITIEKAIELINKKRAN